VEQFDKDGNLLAEFISQSEAGRITGVSQAMIGRCCRKKKYYKTAGGYEWRFKK